MQKALTRLLAPFGALAVAIGIMATPVYAGEDRGLCKENHDRGQIPGDFVLDACFDGSKLKIKNGTQFPLVIGFTGNDVGSVKLDAKASGGASRLIAYLHPGQFGRTPVINAPDKRSGIVPPGYYVQASIGHGEAKVKVTTADKGVQKTYALAETIWRFAPGVDIAKAVAELVRELADVGTQYIECMDRNTNAWGDLGCRTLMVRNVTFAYGRAAIAGVGGELLNALIGLFDTAKWADAASGDLIKLKGGRRDFTIAAYQPPPEQPKPQNPPPPTNNDSGGSNGGGNSSGGTTGGNNTGGGTNDPPPPVNNGPVTQLGTVQNKHLAGASGLEEDSTPAYLSTATRPYCKSNGCAVAGTDMWSGDTFTAICWVDGDTMTNENRNTSADDGNPNKVDTTKWVRGSKNGRLGYISFIYVTPDTRNNPGLVHC